MKFLLLAALFATLSSVSHADSWAPPNQEIFSSANGKFLLHVTPKTLESAPVLPRDLAGNAKERESLGFSNACHATLFERREGKRVERSAPAFFPLWRRKLVNEVRPMNGYISDDGHYVVTTDDYAKLGYGDNVVVIYNAEGTLIRRFKLTDFTPEAVIQRMPQSIKSIYWSGRLRIDTKNGLLLLEVWESGPQSLQASKRPTTYRTVPVRLSTGEILKEQKSKPPSAPGAAGK